MYRVESSGALAASRRRLLTRGRSPKISRTVILLGLTSLFTDVSAEMVSTVLPLYLIYTLGFTPLQYGFVDGLYQGAAALVRIGGGFVGDRLRRHKEVAGVGYALSAACKLALVAVGSSFSAIATVVMADRIGKGIRTAPRDAMISLTSRREDLGVAFGVHRSLDTVGALLGPLVAFALLALAPRAFDSIFLLSFLIALVGLAILVLFVQNPARSEPAERERAGSDDEPEQAEDLLSVRESFKLLRSRRLLGLIVIASMLGLATISDAFLYLGLQQRLDLDATAFPLLFIGTAAIYMLLAAPIGRVADRVGRGKVFFAGYSLMLGVYAALLFGPATWVTLVVTLVLLGGFYAATDGVLMALASEFVPEAVRGSGLALVGTANGLTRFAASILFGLLWTTAGIHVAIVAFAGALALALAATAIALPTVRRRADV
jgi:MFS family permease